MIKIIIITVGIAFLITLFTVWVVDSFTTYKRLNRLADELIADTGMKLEDKRENLSWYALNAIRRGDVSFPFFKYKFYVLHTKLIEAKQKIDN